MVISITNKAASEKTVTVASSVATSQSPVFEEITTPDQWLKKISLVMVTFTLEVTIHYLAYRE